MKTKEEIIKEVMKEIDIFPTQYDDVAEGIKKALSIQEQEFLKELKVFKTIIEAGVWHSTDKKLSIYNILNRLNDFKSKLEKKWVTKR